MTLAFCMFFAGSALSQMRIIYPENAKAISSPLPSFPVEAKELIYGDEVRVLMDIDTQGKVKGALAYGPLAPCSNLADPIVEAVKKRLWQRQKQRSSNQFEKTASRSNNA